MTELSTQVVVIGGGPVGMVSAIDLARRGIDVVMLETRHAGEPPSVKCNHVSARTMEIFRRLGFADIVRNAGLPADYPHDVSYRTTSIGPEITRIRIASRAERFTEADTGCDSTWPTPEPPHRINQIFLEPLMAAEVAKYDRITALYRTEMTGFAQDGSGVTVTARDLDSGETVSVRADYMIGCDGGRSQVRKGIGAQLEGDAVIQRVQSSYIRAPGLIEQMQAGRAWAMFSMNPRRVGNVYSIDGKETWIVHNYLKPDEPDFDSVDRDAGIRAILGVGPEFHYELLNKEDWFGRRLVANKLREDRVFISGDAAHLWVPYAGYGMNAGIADATNLTWILAAHINGWAPEGILAAHQAERLPITEQVSHFAMNHCIAMASQRSEVPADIEETTPEAEAHRAAFAREVYDLNVAQYCCGGLNFGYYYDASPIIAYDGASQPGYTMNTFTSSIVPGCRAPHLWLEGGQSLYDALGDGYNLLRFDSSIEAGPLESAAQEVGLPLQVVDVVTEDPLREVYSAPLVLVRPDQHVAWRGDRLPPSPRELVDRLRGAA
ncbi:FAD-dependent oxidoreductase [Sinisalibacter aestuarii]|uniref:Monooxygenase n=1 Tax=Sinisalibacter aestuarii TaxID=2949426 RepID=A0ABQ5LZP5_9RHOB|nr:FAD-dependent oxidoreductase [Sinisalibacter aestuarii]GKY89935.1 monooxygenase [Sinisalibacter aestuarii]